jgi:hypothetical protein
MPSIIDFFTWNSYDDVLSHGDKLHEIDKIIGWDIFHLILSKSV